MDSAELAVSSLWDAVRVASPSWVSKTDVTDYIRCPYAFWLADTGQITRADMLSEFETELVDAGVGFEREIVGRAQPITLPEGGVRELLRGEHTLLGTPGVRNERLCLRGRPDGIETAGGALEPIEIKSHRLLRRSDRIELAFYWLLLDDHRTARHVAPAGWMFLRQRDGSHLRQRVEISPELLDETRDLIAAIRRARVEGVVPIRCRCTVCRGLHREHVNAVVQERRHVSAVHGVGRTFSAALEQAGLSRWEDLVEADAEVIAAAVSAILTGRTVSPGQVERWRWHARSLIEGVPVPGPGTVQFPVGESFIALDAEYTADNVWLIGARVVDPAGDQRLSWWASPAGEREALTGFGVFVDQWADLPIVTWNGNAADLPALAKAAARSEMEKLVDSIRPRHIDLYRWLCDHLMLPIQGFGLKDVGEHFRLPRTSAVTSGFQAEQQWRRYCRTGEQELKAELVGYNSDDVDSLCMAVECLRAAACNGVMNRARLPDVIEDTLVECEPGGPPVPGLTTELRRPLKQNPGGRRESSAETRALVRQQIERIRRRREERRRQLRG